MIKSRYKKGVSESHWRCHNHECPSFNKLVVNGDTALRPCAECKRILFATRRDPHNPAERA